MIALIGARANSKGLPNKHLLDLNGKPLIQWTLEAALECEEISEVYLSTDSPQIQKVAEKIGAIVPFLRPRSLAQDDSPAWQFYRHFLENVNFGGNSIVVLQATSPLRKSRHISEAISLYHQLNAQCIVSVKKFSHPISWIFTPTSNGSLSSLSEATFLQEQNRQSSQAEYYFPNGALKVFNKKFLQQHQSYLGPCTYPYVMSNEESVDIDTLFDFKMAEFLLKQS